MASEFWDQVGAEVPAKVRTLADMTPEERAAVCAELGRPMSGATLRRLAAEDQHRAVLARRGAERDRYHLARVQDARARAARVAAVLR